MNVPRQRFYREVSVGHRGEGEKGYSILLDGKPIRTPAGNPLALPNSQLAEAVAAEWRAQENNIDPATMMLTKLANTATDRVAPNRALAAQQTLDFGRSDLLCYRAESPADLVAREDRIWNPLLEWARSTYGIELQCGAGVAYIEQPAGALAALERAISRHTDFELAACHAAATLTGSAIIALALAAGRIGAAQAFSMSELDEAYQAERWGVDEEAERRSRKKLDELVVIAQLFGLLRGP
jgi:chaperone required for assembly of F1-ATPase